MQQTVPDQARRSLSEKSDFELHHAV